MPFTASDKLRRPLTGGGACGGADGRVVLWARWNSRICAAASAAEGDAEGGGGTVRIDDGILDIGNGAALLRPAAIAVAIAEALSDTDTDTGIGFGSVAPLLPFGSSAALVSRWWRWRTVRCAKAPDFG